MIAKEGYPFIVGAVVALLVFLILPKFILVSVVALLLVLFLWFFRDPERTIPSEPNIAVSAADGKVVEIVETELNGVKYKKVGVFMNVFSVHVNRIPLTGTISAIKHIAGSFVNASKPEASIMNERNMITIDTQAGRIVVVQVAGLIARRTVCNAEVGDLLATGDRFGMIKFSSRVDHYFPMNFEIEAKLDEHVTAGESIIARFRK